jgi:hypothetical protein
VEPDFALDAEVTGITVLPDGRVLAVGSVPGSGGRVPRAWVGDQIGRGWEEQAVGVDDEGTTDVGAVELRGVGTSATGPVGTGSIDDESVGETAAVWSLLVDQPS